MDAKLWHDMFHLGVPVAEKVLRPVVVYAFLVVASGSPASASWRSSIPST